MYSLNRRNKSGQRGVAILVALSVAAILFVLVNALIFSVITTEKQRIASDAEVDLLALEKLGVENALLLISKGDVENVSYETDAGVVSIKTLRVPNDDDREVLYKEPLSPREGDRVLRVYSEMPSRGQAVYMESTYIVNATPQQERRLRLLSRRGNKENLKQTALPTSTEDNEPEPSTQD